MYNDIGIKPTKPLQGKLTDKIFTVPKLKITDIFPDYKRLDASGYVRDRNSGNVSSRTVVEISRQLYQLLAEPRDGRSFLRGDETAQLPGKTTNCDEEFKQSENARETSAALVARELLQSHPDYLPGRNRSLASYPFDSTSPDAGHQTRNSHLQ